ncbi:MMPL family transporter [Streptomyces sp. NPDC003016]
MPDVDHAVAGKTAVPHDFARQVNSRTPLVFAFVLALAFVLLVVAFRSLAIPLVSIAFDLLSTGAAYGVPASVFQEGRPEPVLGFTPYGGVVSRLPLFMFITLSGLSTDYLVLVLSRARERGSSGADAREAVVAGIEASAGAVTSAAVIMTGVFSVFVTPSAIEYRTLGTGLAVAVLADATVVRGVLLPAATSLLAGRAWALPGRAATSGGPLRR